jgi:hypothetical protein
MTRRLLVLLAIGAGSLVAAGSAQAAPVAVNSGTFGDCRLTAVLDRSGGYERAEGNVNCSHRHASTSAWTTLQHWSDFYDRWVNVRQVGTTFTNSFGLGTRWLNTPNVLLAGCGYSRAVLAATISGLGSRLVYGDYRYSCAA